MIDTDNIIDQYINDVEFRKDNANVGTSINALYNQLSEAGSSNWWFTKHYTPDIINAHKNGYIYIHNLGYLSSYCVGWNLEDLLTIGLKGSKGMQRSGPPKHFGSALALIAEYMFALQNEAAGAMAFSNFDTWLAPFIRKDGLKTEDLIQPIQEFRFRMNMDIRRGGQSVFSNITLDRVIPKFMIDEQTIIGGELQDDTFGSYQDEMDMFNDAWWNVAIKGDYEGRTQPFPIETLNVDRDFKWDDELLFKAVAKRGNPYFALFENSDMKPEDARSMCPLKGTEKVLIKTKNGLRYSEIRHIYYDYDEPIEIYSNGKWVKGLFNKYDNQELIKITLENGHNISITKTHLNLIKTARNSQIVELMGSELKEGYYLPYGLNEYEGSGGTYETGYIVGAFAGDGSFDGSTTTVFSLNVNEKESVVKNIINISEKLFGATYSIIDYQDTELLTLRIHSKAMVGLCKDFVSNKMIDKHYNPKLYGMSLEFRKGVFNGHHDTDGGNRNRIYTSSLQMVESLNMLAATLGTTTSIQIDDRSDRYSTIPNYSVLFYKLNRNSYGDMWFKEDNYLWMRIKSIESEYGNTGYCLEVINDEPIFTVGTSGIITHNCRLRIDNRILMKKGGGLFGASPLTGSIGVVTLNLPLIAYTAKNETNFFELIDFYMDIAMNSLLIKRNVIEKLTDYGLYPRSKIYLGKIKERFNEYWANHFNTIGIVGMNEALENMFGHNIVPKAGQDFAIKTLNYLRNRAIEYQEKYNTQVNIEATPAETAAWKLAVKSLTKYPNLITSGTKEAPIFTNSTQLPVGLNKPLGFFLEHQSPIQKLYTGGTVFHVWNGESNSYWEGVSKLIRSISKSTELSYVTYTPTTSLCPAHGLISGEHWTCPTCGGETEVWSRITGYFSEVNRWNAGKRQEFKERTHFSINN